MEPHRMRPDAGPNREVRRIAGGDGVLGRCDDPGFGCLVIEIGRQCLATTEPRMREIGKGLPRHVSAFAPSDTPIAVEGSGARLRWVSRVASSQNPPVIWRFLTCRHHEPRAPARRARRRPPSRRGCATASPERPPRPLAGPGGAECRLPAHGRGSTDKKTEGRGVIPAPSALLLRRRLVVQHDERPASFCTLLRTKYTATRHLAATVIGTPSPGIECSPAGKTRWTGCRILRPETS